jgi:hypothetical protein
MVKYMCNALKRIVDVAVVNRIELNIFFYFLLELRKIAEIFEVC